MAIIVGTIMVQLTSYVSMRRMTQSGSNCGMNTDVAPEPGMPSTAAIDAAWNIGVWCR